MWIKPETQLYNTSYLYSVFADVNNNFGIKLTNNGDLFSGKQLEMALIT